MKKITNRLIIGLTGIALIFMSFTAVKAYADTTSNIPLCEITRGLTVGATGDDVKCLQRYLNWNGYTVATVGVGSPGNESSYFGQLTANAVKQWQNANASVVLTPLGLTSGTGYWGQASFNYYVTRVHVALGLAV